MNMGEQVFVSIVMLIYKLEYFEDVFDSVFGQIYLVLELIICDDSSDEWVVMLVEQKCVFVVFLICYFCNEMCFGELGSMVKGICLVEGEYVKFFYDDDVLFFECVEVLVGVMECELNVVLVLLWWLCIDEEGQLLLDILVICFLFVGDVLIDGCELVLFFVDYIINFIGEFSCLMVWCDVLLQICECLMMFNGWVIDWIGDLVMCVQLLQCGDLVFLLWLLICFCVFCQQFSQIGCDQFGIGEQGYVDFCLVICELGWYCQVGDNCFVWVVLIICLDVCVFKLVNLFVVLRWVVGFGSVMLLIWLEVWWLDVVQKVLID